MFMKYLIMFWFLISGVYVCGLISDFGRNTTVNGALLLLIWNVQKEKYTLGVKKQKVTKKTAEKKTVVKTKTKK